MPQNHQATRCHAGGPFLFRASALGKSADDPADDGQSHLHATILHLLGLDHEELSYRYYGRDFRLTDVHGKVNREIIA